MWLQPDTGGDNRLRLTASPGGTCRARYSNVGVQVHIARNGDAVPEAVIVGPVRPVGERHLSASHLATSDQSVSPRPADISSGSGRVEGSTSEPQDVFVRRTPTNETAHILFK